MAVNCGEIITLQLGNYSNYIGTHWWNIQESSFVFPEDDQLELEINQDVMFREGKNLYNQFTYLPRLVLVDTSSNFGSYAVNHSSLYGDCNPDADVPQWNGECVKYETEPEEKNEFLTDLEKQDVDGDENKEEDEEEEDISNKCYNLKDEVKSWSDYKRLIYHPNTPTILNERSYSQSWLGTFNEAKNVHFFDDFEEKVRFFAEECDFLQGFNLMGDMEDGFGGLTGLCLEYLHDEYGNKQRATFLTSTPERPNFSTIDDKLNSVLATTLTLSAACEHASFVVPMSLRTHLFSNQSSSRRFPHLIYDASNLYQSSAIIAAAYETMMLPCRRLEGATTLPRITQRLVQTKRKILSLKASLPCQFEVDKKDGTVVVDGQLQSLTPGFSDYDAKIRVYAQMTSLVGASTVLGSKRSAFSYRHVSGRVLTNVDFVETLKNPMRLRTPFPDILSPAVDYDGFISNGSDPHEENDYEMRSRCQSSVVSAQLQSDVQTKSFCKEIVDSSKSLMRWVTRPRHSESAMEVELYEQAIEYFRSARSDYGFCPDMNSSDDSDEDDDHFC